MSVMSLASFMLRSLQVVGLQTGKATSPGSWNNVTISVDPAGQALLCSDKLAPEEVVKNLKGDSDHVGMYQTICTRRLKLFSTTLLALEIRSLWVHSTMVSFLQEYGFMNQVLKVKASSPMMK